METATFAIAAKKRQMLRTIKRMLELVMFFLGIVVSSLPFYSFRIGINTLAVALEADLKADARIQRDAYRQGRTLRCLLMNNCSRLGLCS